MKDQQSRPHPCTHEEWAARGVTWTARIPPLSGHYWWIGGQSFMPTVADLRSHANDDGEWTWTTARGEVFGSSIDNGLWWPVPMVMPPPLGCYPVTGFPSRTPPSPTPPPAHNGSYSAVEEGRTLQRVMGQRERKS
jgi:hypothetical protein